jgi:hypothetical protein
LSFRTKSCQKQNHQVEYSVHDKNNPRTAAVVRPPVAHFASAAVSIRGLAARRNLLPEGSAQPIEKAHFGRGNPRKSKPFSLIVFARFSRGFAGFG